MRKISSALFSVLICSITVLAQDKWSDQGSVVNLNDSVVNSHNGSFTTGIPVQCPSYFGIEPELSLSYSSDGKTSPYGVGWGLSGASSIERAGQLKGQPDLSTNDIFIFDGAELVPCAKQTSSVKSPSCLHGGTHSTKNESYQKIKYVSGSGGSDSWQVTSTGGVLTEYKPLRTASSASGAVTVFWGISKVTDLHNRTVHYDYALDLYGGKSVTLDKIRYNNDKYKIKFHWNDVPVNRNIKYAQAGSIQDIRVRLFAISIIINDGAEKTAAAYTFTYDDPSSSNVFYLKTATFHGVGVVLDEKGVINTPSTPQLLGSFEYDLTDPVWSNGSYVNSEYIKVSHEEDFFRKNAINPVVGTDLDGDGLTDLVRSARVMYKGSLAQGAWFNLNQTIINKSRIPNTTVPLVYDSKWTLPANTSIYELELPKVMSPPALPVTEIIGAESHRYGQFADLNGDGKSDFIYKTQKYLNTGLGWKATSNWATPGTYNKEEYADINGDGFADLLRITRTKSGTKINETYINTGTAFQRTTHWDFPADAYLTNDFPEDSKRPLISFVDMNNDGLMDLFSPGKLEPDSAGILRKTYEGVIYLNTGRGFEKSAYTSLDLRPGEVAFWVSFKNHQPYLLKGSCTTTSRYNVASCGGSLGGVSVIGDSNGDGYSDLIFTRSGVEWMQSAAKPDLLKSIRGPLGSLTKISYIKSTKLDNSYKCTVEGVADMNGASSCQGLPHNKWLVDSLSVDASGGHPTPRDPVATTNYTYAGGLYDGIERTFLGFRYVKETMPKTPSEPVAPQRETWYKMTSGLITTPERIDFSAYSAKTNALALFTSQNFIYKTNGTLIPRTSQVETEWNYSYDGSGTVCNFKASASPCTAGLRTRADFTYDQYGNLLTQKNYGDFDKTGDDLITSNLYKVNADQFITDLSYETTTREVAGNTVLSQTRKFFDNSATLGAVPIKGLLTQGGNWLDTLNNGAGGFVFYKSTYDTLGRIKTKIDPDGNITTYTYDTVIGKYITEVKNHLDHVIKNKWDYICGEELEVTDVNGQVSKTQFDKLCRPVRSETSSGKYERWEYNQNNVGGFTTYAVLGPQGSEVKSTSLFDGLGRVYESQRDTQNGPARVAKYFNAKGFVTKETLPYLSSPDYSRRFEYDSLGRLTKAINSDGTFSSVEHAHNSIMATDEENSKMMQLLDGSGRVVEQRELDSAGTWLNKKLTYNSKGDLSEIRDHADHVWSITYDSFGRRIKFTDPDAGEGRTVYNWNGNIVETISNAGSITKYKYDKLGRVLEKLVDAGTALEKKYLWYYDEARTGFFNKGHLTSTVSPEGGRQLNYDKEGRIAEEIVLIKTKVYKKTFEYKINDQLSKVTYPDGTIIEYQYNNVGDVTAIPGYLDLIQYDFRGNILEIRNNNGTRSYYTYTPHRNWLSSIHLKKDTTSLLSLTMNTRDNMGRIRTLYNSGVPTDYEYDALGYLKSVKSSGVQQTFNYDTLGNIKSKTKGGVTSEYHYGKALFGSSSTQISDWQENYGSDTSGECVNVPGDYDGDGDVDGRDFLKMQRGETPTPRQCPNANWSTDCAGNYTNSKMPGMPHAVHRFGSEAYCYDLNGRMIRSSSGRKITYSGLGKPIQVDNEKYFYDEEGSRIIKEGEESIYYPFGDNYEDNITKNQTTLFLSVGSGLSGGPVVMKTGSVKTWMQLDHQGSVRVITDQNGNIIGKKEYEPFGDVLSETGTTKSSMGFTGQRQDKTGLFYLHARYYDPKLGRFISPDPKVPSIKLLGLNRYSYGENDPVNKEDRNGMQYGGGYRGGGYGGGYRGGGYGGGGYRGGGYQGGGYGRTSNAAIFGYTPMNFGSYQPGMGMGGGGLALNSYKLYNGAPELLNGHYTYNLRNTLSKINKSRSTVNCIFCSIATHNTALSGFATEAPDNMGTLKNLYNYADIPGTGRPITRNFDTVAELKAFSRSLGKGSSLAVITSKGAGYQHAFNLFYDTNGDQFFADGQISQAYREFDDELLDVIPQAKGKKIHAVVMPDKITPLTKTARAKNFMGGFLSPASIFTEAATVLADAFWENWELPGSKSYEINRNAEIIDGLRTGKYSLGNHPNAEIRAPREPKWDWDASYSTPTW